MYSRHTDCVFEREVIISQKVGQNENTKTQESDFKGKNIKKDV